MFSVETIGGPVSTSDLGFTLMHEHVLIFSEGIPRAFPRTWDEKAGAENAVKTLAELKAKGVDTIIDATVHGLGRDVPPLIPIVKAAGIQVIAATGIYTFEHLPPFFESRSVEEMADLFVADITEGIQGTSVKAAVLKCATDAPGVTPGVEKVLRATAQAHRRTGVPITTHTHAGLQRGLDQQRLFGDDGVDLKRVIIGHCGDTEDIDYLTKLIDAGSYIGMDRFGLPILTDDKRVAVIAKLCEMGYAERMVISQDTMAYWDHYKPELRSVVPNWNYFDIVDNVIPMMLEAGITQSQIDLMTRENPRRIFENVEPY
jgi:phosphotriesterase-related protein